MNPVTLDKEELRELIGQSHQAISTVASNGLFDLKKKLAQVDERNEKEHQQLMSFMNESKQSQIRIEDVLNEHGKTIDSTFLQATKTNGTVREHEKMIAEAKGWTKGIGLCLATILVLVSVIFYTEIDGIKNKIDGVKDLFNQHVNAQTK